MTGEKKLQLCVFANDEEKDIIVNGSPFCTKVELLCLVAGIPYEKPTLKPGDMGVRGKLPYAIFPNGEVVPDSGNILAKIKKENVDLDAGLSPEALVTSRLLIATLEESFYFVFVYYNWQHSNANWQKTKAGYFDGLPFLIRGVIARSARKAVIKSLYGQGMGRRPEEEIIAIAKTIIDDAAFLLGDKKNLFGTEKLTNADVILYSAMEPVLYRDIPDNPIKPYIETKTNLVAFINAVGAEYFPKIHANRTTHK